FGLVGWRSARFHHVKDRRPSRRRQFAYAVFSGATHEVILTPSFEIRRLDDLATSGEPNAVNISSARTTKRFPSPRCASAIHIVRPSRSSAETQPQLHPASLRLSAITSQYFTRASTSSLEAGSL